MKSKEKRRLREQAVQSQAASAPAPVGKRVWKRRLALGVIMLVVAGAVWALFEFVLWNELPTELVGKWEIADGQHSGDTFEFHRNGSMIGTVYPNGRVGTIKARVRLEGKTLHFTSKSESGEMTTQKQTIRSLNERELILEAEDGARLKLEKIE